MDRRHFLKTGLALTGTILVSAFMPVAALTKDSTTLAKNQSNLLAMPGTASLCNGNDACVIIDPAVFTGNIKTLKNDVGPDVRLCIVMKSDAYGHGLDNLMLGALRANPAYIGLVGNHDIRKAVTFMNTTRMRTTILRIAPATFFEAAEAMLNNWPVEETIGSIGQAEALSRITRWIGEKRGEKCVVPVHINVDTGMGRMGFVNTDDIKKAMTLPGIKIRGIMTHFANAYNLEHGRELTRRQMDKFDAVLSGLELPEDVIIHTANSGAALSFPWTRRDMVRVGGALYGDIPGEMNPEGRYRRAMSAFLSSVVWIMEVPQGTSVGYDSKYHTPKDRHSTLATVKIGYNNGFPPDAYEKGSHLLIRGKRFPVVGKTSMNMVVVDVTDQKKDDKVRLGDEVVILGRQCEQEISWEDLENTTGVPSSVLMLAIGNANLRLLAPNSN